MTNQNSNTKPTHNICKKTWTGKRTEFDQIGVAWEKDNGLYIKLYGTQIVDGGFYAFLNSDQQHEGGR